MKAQTSNFSSHPTIKKLFSGRKMMICTMHGKGHVMRPLIKQYLDLNASDVMGLDTDEFGTFSGEIERPFDTLTTLRKKILKGLRQSGESLGIGNEGSFGPHPNIPFVPADQETVMLIDLENELEIFQSTLSLGTNYFHGVIHDLHVLNQFAERIEFPSHGMILRQEMNRKTIRLKKGITTWEELHSSYLQMSGREHVLVAESDMRAFLNPTRMKVIEQATLNLMKKVISTCPECQYPGFGIEDTKTGLPCSQCDRPTKLILIMVYGCKRCGCTDERINIDHKADAAYCDYCNP